jgi:hypothetical protein
MRLAKNGAEQERRRHFLLGSIELDCRIIQLKRECKSHAKHVDDSCPFHGDETFDRRCFTPRSVTSATKHLELPVGMPTPVPGARHSGW